MKYPTRITFELKKKLKSKKRYLDFICFFKKRIGSKVFINFKQHDARSGIDYKIIDILNYDNDELEIKLIRADCKNDENN